MTGQTHDTGVPARVLDALRRATTRITALEQMRHEAIAVVGASCRLPGGIGDLDALWRALEAGRDAIEEVPASRWRARALYDPDPDAPGRIVTDQGGFLTGVELFDPQFFGISPRETLGMDPQQRLLLELAWEALEDAATDWGTLRSSSTGVFVGATNNDYARVLLQACGPDEIDAHFASGNALNAIAGRVAYTLGLEGPCLTVDTACSSSLVAVHLACQSLRNEECAVAIAGGINLILTPEASIATSRAHMLAPDGRCKAFDASANGYVRSEGGAAVVLMRLSEALREGRPVLAVIRGSAVNQNGVTSGFTVPSARAQEALISAALSAAGVRAEDVGYVEAHGTGTALGDPIELAALQAAYGVDARRQPLLVGSIKSNIGHAESAAGLAGLLKAILVVRNGRSPPSLHVREPTPRFDWNRSKLAVCTTVRDLPSTGPRLAGVSSFGASGTNAHLIVEAPAPPQARPAPPTPRARGVLTISARSAEALQEAADATARWLSQADEPFHDICRTAHRRRAWPHRLAVMAETAREASEALIAHVRTGHHPAVQVSDTRGAWRKPVRFLLPAAASYDARLAAELYASEEGFRRVIDRAAAELGRVAAHGLSRLRDGEGDDDDIDAATAFLIAIGQAGLWRAWGLEPEEFAAEGSGLLACAHLSGAGDLAWVRRILEGADAAPAGAPRRPVFAISDGRDLAPELALAGACRGLSAAASDRCPPSPERLEFDTAREGPAEVLAKAFLGASPIDWSAATQDFAAGPAALPKSRFDRRPYWPARRSRPASAGAPTDELADVTVRIAGRDLTVLECDVRANGRDIFQDHLVFDHVVVAGACHISLMLEASRRRWPGQTCVLSDVRFAQALVVPETGSRKLQASLFAEADGHRLSVVSLDEAAIPGEPAAEVLHATASAAPGAMPSDDDSDDLAAVRARCTRRLEAPEFYAQLQRNTHIEHRHAFRWVASVSAGPGVAVGRLRPPEGSTTGATPHPGLIDSCFQLLAAAFGSDETATFVPYGARAVSICGDVHAGEMTGVARVVTPAQSNSNRVVGAVRLYGADDALLAAFEDVEFRRATPGILLRGLGGDGHARRFGVAWRERAAAPASPIDETVMLAADPVLGDQVCRRLAEGGGRAETIGLATPEPGAPDGLGEAAREPIERALARLLAREASTRVVYFNGRSGDAGAPHGDAGLLRLAQGLVAGRARHVELTVLTVGAVAAEPIAGTLRPDQAALWGFARVLENEHRELKLRLLDVDPAGDEPAAVADAIAALGPGEHAALRRGVLYEPHLAPVADTATPLAVRDDRSYLVTGGRGALGSAVAQHLVREGARHLVLMGRTAGEPPAAEPAAQPAHGVSVTYLAVDVADGDALQAALARITPPLAGVVHAAGVLDDAMVKDVHWAQMQRVFAPKVVGAWNLHRATAKLDLDFFVLFSSASALLGSPGQSAYAAANASLDALAAYRRQLGLPATSISWGPWADAGMAARLAGDKARFLSAAGIAPLPADEALATLLASAAERAPHVAVLRLETGKLAATAALAPPRSFLRDLAGGAAVAAGAAAGAELSQVLALAAGEAREAYVRDYCRARIGEILQLAAQDVPPDLPMANLGVDSLMALEFSADLRRAFGVELPLAQLMEGTTIALAAAYVSAHLPERAEDLNIARDPSDVADSVQIGAVISDLDSLSEAEINALLERLQGEASAFADAD